MSSSAKHLTLPVTGMTCANCAATIERNVRKLAGVELANVNLASEKLTVDFDPAVLDERAIIARVQKAGYGVATGKADLPITGLRDASDALALEKMLARLDGVLAASVVYGADRAHLEYVPGLTSLADLAAVIRKSGHEVLAAGEDESGEDVEAAARAAEVRRQSRLLALGLACTAPLMVYSMARDFGLVRFAGDIWAMLLAATLVQFGVGWQYYVGAFKGLRAGGANMDVLIAMGSSVAYAYSVVVAFGLVPGVDHVYFETSAAIITLIMLGKFLEARARGRTSEAIKKLAGLRARTARVLRAGAEAEIEIEKVGVGDVLVVRPGEKVPVDGVILEGRATLDESMLTGESMPVAKGPGDDVISATLNKDGLFKFEATRVGKHTVLAQIIRLVQEAQGSKAPIQKLADQVSAYFVPAVIALAALTFFGWLLLGGVDWTRAMINAVAVLVIACPCALGLATPTAIMVGSGKGAEHGILFRNSEALERLQRVTTVVFDKTGTLTRGEPAVTDVVALPGAGLDEAGLLRLAASAERGSEHPLGQAIVAAAEARGLRLAEPHAFQAVAGFGIRAEVEGRAVVIGNPRLLRNEGLDLALVQPEIERLQGEGKTAMLVAADGRLAGAIAVADTLKPGAAEALAELRLLGLDLVMLTGDNARTAEAIARQAGLERVIAEVLPGDKAAVIRDLQTAGGSPAAGRAPRRVVAMVGDGLNDAPALAQADVGIAIGTGTDVAMAAAGVTLIGGDLHGVGRAISLSRGTLRTILQNLFWAFFYNVVLIPVAALGLLVPVIAAGAMAFSSIFVVTNSLRLRGFKVQAVEPPQSRARQVLEMVPHLVAPMAALAVLIALSAGWIALPGAGQAGGHGGSSGTFTARVTGLPAEIPVGQPVAFTLAIVDEAGNPRRQLMLMDEKPLHLVLVSRDLTYFKHAYPERSADGTFPMTLTFPAAGDYVLFGDYMPLDGRLQTLDLPLRAGPPGARAPAARLVPEAAFSRVVGDLTITLTTPGPFQAGRYATLVFDVTETATGALVMDLEQYLGALGHAAIVDEAGETFLRVHASKKRTDFSTLFPKPGRYKLWAEFQRGGQIYLASFVVEAR